MKLNQHLFLMAILIGSWSQALAQSDPSSYCGPGTLWSETLQQCVSNPAIEPAAYDGDDDGCIAVNDLLGLLSVFGDCEPAGSTIYWFKYTEGWPYAYGDWTDETTEFYVADCSNDSGYVLTTDLTLTMEFILESGDSLLWCGNDTVYPVMPIESLDGVDAISHEDIPNGTISIPTNYGLFYMVIPQSFEENALLLEQAFFDQASCGWAGPFLTRRELTIYSEPYWLYSVNAYGGLNVLCGY